jgi:hypothetical protein
MSAEKALPVIPPQGAAILSVRNVSRPLAWTLQLHYLDPCVSLIVCLYTSSDHI